MICSEKSYSVRQFVEAAYQNIGVKIIWKGNGLKEVGLDKKSKKVLIRVSPKYFRPNEVDNLKGSSAKARKILKWRNTVSFKSLVEEMVSYEINVEKKKNLNNEI